MQPKIALAFGSHDVQLTHTEITLNWNPQVFFTWMADKSHLFGSSTAEFKRGIYHN